MREQTLGARHPLDTGQLDAFVQRALTELDVPGAAIAVIDDGKVVYEGSAAELRQNQALVHRLAGAGSQKHMVGAPRD